MKTIVLFDDERSFRPGFRDEAIVIRSVDQALEEFPKLSHVHELWLDYILFPGVTTDAFHALKGVTVDRVIFHSSAFEARSLVATLLQRQGIHAEVEFPEDPSVVLKRYTTEA